MKLYLANARFPAVRPYKIACIPFAATTTKRHRGKAYVKANRQNDYYITLPV
ncbi:tryptophan synthase alpha subunit [Dysgonomonas sp. PFB1-18]|uniref:hypothetical protein n=1 Tax=unclassified Dysgonomonas TaxID=2630389 RepID=UPI0024759825|nr:MULTISPECIES: hypothetical protein [unclassified Dysgonomonas]MDH6380943.1 tryptophan synthase alpha subunit [Dysgonomonas sp. PFB1-18]MDH6397952.1 tryptophan synthase alpha subunit [Dysgonomonas sp. PF1-23]